MEETTKSKDAEGMQEDASKEDSPIRFQQTLDQLIPDILTCSFWHSSSYVTWITLLRRCRQYESQQVAALGDDEVELGVFGLSTTSEPRFIQMAILATLVLDFCFILLGHPHKPSEYPNLLLFILDKTHFTVTFATAAVLLYTRNPHVAWFTIGAVATMQSAKLIKLLIREQRPPVPPPSASSKPSPLRPKKTFGMPSTHATALSFYHGYLLPLVPSLVVNYLPVPLRSYEGVLSFDQTRFLASLSLTLAWALGLWSRVELGYHTYPQIAVGALLGELAGMGWRTLWWSQRKWAAPLLTDWMEWGWSLTLGKVF